MDDICYEKNFIDNAIVRLDFASPVEKFFKNLPSSLEKKILKSFPKKEPQETVQNTFSIGPNGHSFEQKQKGVTWLFHSRDRDSTIEISTTHFVVVERKYKTFEMFLDKFTFVCEELFKEQNNFMVNRMGLRFVNTIRLPCASFKDYPKYINPRMICSLEVPVDPAAISRSFHNLTLNYEAMNIQFQYGVFNPDFPARVKRNEFVLDIDAYCDGLIEQQDVSSNLNKFHSEIQMLFERSITDELRRLMVKK